MKILYAPLVILCLVLGACAYQVPVATTYPVSFQKKMQAAANEEEDHLAWCQKRLDELGSKPSLLNPLFYSASFSIGALAGIVGDRWSLGFVAETEKQVCKHLDTHLAQLPEEDEKSRAIIQQMKEDEAKHATSAIEAGGEKLPLPIKSAMTLMSRVMTKTTYHL